MSMVNEIKRCLICSERYRIMIPLDQSLSLCGGLSVAQVLQNLHILTISRVVRLRRVLCCMCVAKVQSCHDFITKCNQIGRNLEAIIDGTSTVATMGSFNNNDQSNQENIIVSDNNTKNGNIEEPISTTMDYSDEVSSHDRNESNATEEWNLPTSIANIKEEIYEDNTLEFSDTKPQEPNIVNNFHFKTEIDVDYGAIAKENEDSCDYDNNEEENDNNGNDERKPYVCPVCQKGFATNTILRRHFVIHTGEKPHVCKLCKKSFNRKDKLRIHMMSHSGERPFVCDVCNKTFAQLSGLKIHKFNHSGIKPYVCDICTKAFNKPSDLTKHKVIHTGLRPYACDSCDRSFSFLCNLTKHKVIHTDEKIHDCDICNESFKFKFELKTHKFMHSGKRAYTCDICNKSYASTTTLKRHKQLQHEPNGQ